MKAFAITDIGIKRTTNQDYVYETVDAVGKLPNLFIVADGMGGHKAGDVASREAVEVVIEVAKAAKTKDPISIMQQAINAANIKVMKRARSDSRLEGMGTTMVIATITEKSIYITNVGDSRLYYIDDEIHQITRDHSYVEEMISLGEIDKATARNHEKKNIITRAVGVEEELEADFFEIQYKKGNFILMCSDGLTNMLDDATIREVIKGEEDVDVKAHKLIEMANENGGKDNIAVLIVEI